MPDPEPIRVALLAMDPLRSIGLQSMFEGAADIQFILDSTVDSLADESIHMVVLGARLGSGTYEMMAEIQSRRPGMRVILMASATHEESILRAIAAGAKGYLTETASQQEVDQAIRIVHSGSVWAPRRVLSLFIERVTKSPDLPAVSHEQPPPVFTQRQSEVLELLVSGRSYLEIAETLHIELRTVKNHVTSLMRKTGVSNRTALTMYAIHSPNGRAEPAGGQSSPDKK